MANYTKQFLKDIDKKIRLDDDDLEMKLQGRKEAKDILTNDEQIEKDEHLTPSSFKKLRESLKYR